MELPFSIDAFLTVFKIYNQAVCPMQILFLALGILAVSLAIKQSRYSHNIMGVLLGTMNKQGMLLGG